MHSTYKLTVIALASSVAAQTTHMVKTGPGLIFNPNTLEGVKEGDMVEVAFSDISHDVASGSFDSPCKYNSDGGVFSGVQEAPKVFRWMINSTDPQVYYCSVGMHCQAGMALVINPSQDMTYKAYSGASKDTTSQDPDVQGPAGGMLFSDSAAASSAMSSSMMSGTMSSMMSSMTSGEMTSTMPATMSGTMSGMMSNSMSSMMTGSMSGSSMSASPTSSATGSGGGNNSAAADLRGGGIAMVGAFVVGAIAYFL